MKLLDLYCGAGGCTRGYQLAGFEVVGVDNKYQKRYCGDDFIQTDALLYLNWITQTGEINKYQLIHASPPCQSYSRSKGLSNGQHPQLIDQTRMFLIGSGAHYVIENVVGAPLINPIMLCGAMFGLTTYRHRLFECSFAVTAPEHPEHVAPQNKLGYLPNPGEFMHVVGHFTGKQQAQEAMGIDWMSTRELAQAIPPAYTKWIGEKYLAFLTD